jgi:hypothetical protein
VVFEQRSTYGRFGVATSKRKLAAGQDRPQSCSVVAQKIFTILRAVYPSRLFRKHGNGSYQRAAVRVCDADLGSE